MCFKIFRTILFVTVCGPLRDTLKVGDQQEVPGRGAFTGSYASPEQLVGKGLTSATDVWSWGVMLLEMFNGKCTWEIGTDAPAALTEIAANGPVFDRAPRLPIRATAVLRRCLSIQPGERWRSLDEAACEIRLAYEETLQHSFPRVIPPVPEAVKTIFTRQLSSGSRWDDPRSWLALAYSLAGKGSAEAAQHLPDPTGSVTSRAVSDLKALEHALEMIDGLYHTGNTAAASNLGRLHGTLGHLCAFLGDVAGALWHYDACADLLAENSKPNDCTSLAICRNSKAIVLRKAGRRAESIAVCDQAIDCWRGLDPRPSQAEQSEILAMLLNTKAYAVEDPAEALQLRSEALSLPELDAAARAKYLAGEASTFGELGDWENADRAFQNARDLFEQLIQKEKRQELRGPLGSIAMNRAYFEGQRRQWLAAIRYSDEAIATLQPLVVEEGQWELAETIGEAHFDRGKALEAVGRPLDALSAYRAAREYLSEIVLRGGRSDLANKLADAFRDEANLNRELGRTTDAVRLSGNAVDLFRRLGQGEQRRQYLPLLCRVLSVQSACLLEENRVPESMSVAQEAINLFRSLPKEDPALRSVDYGGVLLSLGIAARRSGDPQLTWDSYQEALAILESLDEPEALSLKALIQSNSSNLLGDSGNLAESLALLDKAIAMWTDLAQRFGPRFCRDDLLMAHKAKTNQLLKIGAYEEALASANETLPILTQRVMDEGRDDLREDLGKLLSGRAMILKKLGDLDGAIAAFRESARTFEAASDRYHQPEFANASQFMNAEADNLQALAGLRLEQAEQWAAKAEEASTAGTQMSRAGDAFHACELLDDAILIYSVLVKRQSNERWIQALASTQMTKAIMAMYARRDRAAERAFRSAMVGYDRLIRDFHAASKLADWGNACTGLAVFLKTTGRAEESMNLMNAAQGRMHSLGESEYKKWQSSADELLGEV